MCVCKFVPQPELGKAPRLRPRLWVRGALAPPARGLCNRVLGVCARVCSLASVPAAQREPESGRWGQSGPGRGCRGEHGAGAGVRPAPGAGPSEPRALQWDVFSFKS